MHFWTLVSSGLPILKMSLFDQFSFASFNLMFPTLLGWKWKEWEECWWPQGGEDAKEDFKRDL